MRPLLCKLFIVLFFFIGIDKSFAVPFDLVSPNNKVSIVYDKSECKLDSIVANLLANDIKQVSGYLPKILTDISRAKGNVIIIGSINSALITALGDQSLTANLRDKWECYTLKVLADPTKNIQNALVIAGSDLRGTAYGVFDISARIGVTPWYWWADATPVKKSKLSLDVTTYTSAPPSVKYRGIFINDEDWGLQPWAAKTFEPETGDIGPKTYAKVFELLLRLKANLIWPAMHPSTKAFFHFPGNVKAAEEYQIVIGSSHAEPMLRNNVGEWDEKTMGAFNYITNQQKVDDYWETRVKESSRNNVIYSMGMRGVHDSGIEGVKTIKETVPLVERIFNDQREMLKKHVNKDITKVPQAFTPYKEALDVYDGGLKVPGDVTLVWPDDNYGYIQRLNDEKEHTRPGGAGVYYHASYWGRPHDYIWLSTTNPGLIREEMTKAYDADSRTIWVLNVGDIKPAEYNIQFFLDMAYNIRPFNNSAYTRTHLRNWLADNIGGQNVNPMAGALWQYYQLAFERKPEFMGWSQTEPTTQVRPTTYNHQYYGDQAQRRIDSYDQLEQTVKTLKASIAPDKQDSFYQLVYYPIVGASLMNKKYLYRDKALLYAQQGRISAAAYDTLARAAHQNIITETDYYNTKLSGGKWAKIISMHPRDLPVFKAPEAKYTITARPVSWLAIPEGGLNDTIPALSKLILPAFNKYGRQKHFIDLFLTRDTALNYTVKCSADWIKVSVTSGGLKPAGLNGQQRIWVSIDPAKVPETSTSIGTVTIQIGKRSQAVAITALGDHIPDPQDQKGFIEDNGYVSIYAKNYSEKTASGQDNWTEVAGLGATEKGMQALPLKTANTFGKDLSADKIRQRAALTYNFYTFTTAPAEVKIYTIPTYPLNRDFEMRYAVSVDGGPIITLNFKTVGRSEEWKQGVLSNSAVRSVNVPQLNAGKHTLKIYMIDPGVILDRMLIDLGGLKPLYGLIPETKITPVN